jgi:hypothetical protein
VGRCWELAGCGRASWSSAAQVLVQSEIESEAEVEADQGMASFCRFGTFQELFSRSVWLFPVCRTALAGLRCYSRNSMIWEKFVWKIVDFKKNKGNWGKKICGNVDQHPRHQNYRSKPQKTQQI